MRWNTCTDAVMEWNGNGMGNMSKREHVLHARKCKRACIGGQVSERQLLWRNPQFKYGAAATTGHR